MNIQQSYIVRIDSPWPLVLSAHLNIARMALHRPGVLFHLRQLRRSGGTDIDKGPPGAVIIATNTERAQDWLNSLLNQQNPQAFDLLLVFRTCGVMMS
jgi:hypothetical protein